MNSTAIHTAIPEDAALIAPLFDAYRQFYEQPADADAALAFITARLERGESVILLARRPDGSALGFCQLYPSFCSVLAAPIYVLYDLFVAPDARRLGVGRALLLAAEAHARATGHARMDLTTARNNLRAQALYESLGWVRDEVFLTYARHLQA
ncbi:GCN5-related N-acetyltransferase [Delftia acidovorans SPH-1]|uniref:GCN5-related N-acetyltransferase n=2 Tax=Pseudomonadati TaxID=3379134 RepID=A9BM98_DELAS|nr:MULTISPECIES: GNAT family N-acetyltransferase [Delftia]MBA4002489.1 N-acetyltransferase [Delftia sp.]PIF36712.1 ribosomal protein S18 acetylase RimI-like enzyme [Burkholderiales bacterium 23]ABX37443.1 GCN5-related N-acetyltransferase [Delftia acidovorans SPH-1]MBL8353704.1 GNAT family N-acetyltransferase [Delftia acidovorans]MCP4018985.1 GNAT family N-acetyltransferase [Delftia sp.]